MDEINQLKFESAIDELGEQLKGLGFSPEEIRSRLIIEAYRVERELEVEA